MPEGTKNASHSIMPIYEAVIVAIQCMLSKCETLSISIVYHQFLTVVSQWGIDTVYQEDYPSLLYAAETGRKITYNPSNIAKLTQEFSSLTISAVPEVY